MSDTVLKIEGLYKKFTRSLKRSMYYGTTDAFHSMIGLTVKDRLRKSEFWALQDINFELKKGETIGLLGQNGCGKTTLLRLINGIFPPDRGKITINGRIGALIAVGAGFHPQMSGRENIYLNGAILGMSKEEIKKNFDEIVEFAEIGEFLDAPVAVYSSGMYVRLGFAIAIHCNPDILLVDEILAVGDVGFQLKCFNKLGELRQKGVATILVSHNLHHISTFCSSVIVFDKGKEIFLGQIDQGVEIYKASFPDLQNKGEIERVITGTDDFKVDEVCFSPKLVDNKIEFTNQNDIEVTIKYNALKDFNNLEIDCVLRAPIPLTTEYFQANNHAFNKILNIKKGTGKLHFTIRNLNLNNITLYLYFAIWLQDRTECLFWWRNVPVKFIGKPLFSGITQYQLEYFVEE